MVSGLNDESIVRPVEYVERMLRNNGDGEDTKNSRNCASLGRGGEGSLLKQLSIANKSLGGGVVVVLAEREKEEMELDIARMEFDFIGTSVICRSGSPLIMADLKKVSVSKARAIIVLAEVENADKSDARVLRVVLALTGVKEGLRGHIVVELSDLDNEQLVKLVGGDLVETVVAHDVIGRLMIQCSRQPGLAQVLLSYTNFPRGCRMVVLTPIPCFFFPDHTLRSSFCCYISVL